MNIPLPSTKKRKRPNGKESLVPSSFFNLPPDPNSFDTPLSITPFGTASRIFIPVYWVSGSLQLFHAPLAIRPGTVILAKLDGEKTLVCIEWIGDQIFALCKLSEHVRVKELRNVIKVSSKRPVPVDDGAIISAIRDDHGEELWKQIKAPFTKRPIVGLEKFMVEKDLHERENVTTEGGQISFPFSLDDPERISEYLLLQYFEMLYINKTSLAYFVKSTFTKVRVAFKKLEQAPSNPCKFTPSSPLYEKALDGLLLQLHDMEQKYRELKLFCKNTQDEVKLKVRSCEMGFLERWIECDIRGIKDYTVAERLVEQLKIREMQLQVLILLEILAWKHEHADLTKNTPSPKSRKAKAKESVIDKNDPSLRLNICIDRLNLWHTLGPSFILDFLPQKEEVDFLRQFCLEIIMPFYESRIPEKCSSLYVKCGCNVNRSPKEKQKIIKDPLSALTIPPAPTPLPSSARLPRKPKTTFKSIPAPKRRQTNHLSKLAAREIEFKPLKRKQSANLREDLRAAINNIAKPNRMAIGAEIMEAREQRFRKDSRKKDSLQVPATPSNRRTRPRQQDDQSRDLLSPPPKKLRLVSSPIIVEDTPVKSRHKSVSEDIRETPVKGTSRTHHLDQESPTKTSFSSTVALVASSPETVKSTKGIAKEEADIFDQLGWNDY